MAWKYLFVMAGLLLLFIFIDGVPATWVAVSVVLSLAVHRMAAVFSAIDRRRSLPGVLVLVAVSTFGGMALAAASAIILFVSYGWLPALAVVVLFAGYFALMEPPFTAATQAVARLRADLARSVVQWSDDLITDSQLATRAGLALRGNLPREALNLDSVYAPLLAAGDLNPTQHRKLLTLLNDHLAVIERHAPRSSLTKAVQANLGAG